MIGGAARGSAQPLAHRLPPVVRFPPHAEARSVWRSVVIRRTRGRGAATGPLLHLRPRTRCSLPSSASLCPGDRPPCRTRPHSVCHCRVGARCRPVSRRPGSQEVPSPLPGGRDDLGEPSFNPLASRRQGRPFSVTVVRQTCGARVAGPVSSTCVHWRHHSQFFVAGPIGPSTPATKQTAETHQPSTVLGRTRWRARFAVRVRCLRPASHSAPSNTQVSRSARPRNGFTPDSKVPLRPCRKSRVSVRLARAESRDLRPVPAVPPPRFRGVHAPPEQVLSGFRTESRRARNATAGMVPIPCFWSTTDAPHRE